MVGSNLPAREFRLSSPFWSVGFQFLLSLTPLSPES
jgi:hypothetical protein